MNSGLESEEREVSPNDFSLHGIATAQTELEGFAEADPDSWPGPDGQRPRAQQNGAQGYDQCGTGGESRPR